MGFKVSTRFIYYLFSIARHQKRLITIGADATAALIAMWFSFVLRLGEWFPDVMPAWMLLVAPVVTIFGLLIFRFYQSIVRYQGEEMIANALAGMGAASISLAAMTYMLRDSDTPRSVFIIFILLMMFYLAASRLTVRHLYRQVVGSGMVKELVAIFGAGEAGARLILGMKANPHYLPVMVVDDEKNKKGTLLAGVPVQDRDGLSKAVEGGVVKTVLLAIPSLGRSQRIELIEWLEGMKLHVMTVPDISDIATGKARIEDIKDIAIEDLLGRGVVPAKPELLGECINNKNVLVTGAGGSIGSELCRQIIYLGPNKIILYELSEYALYKIEKELQNEILRLDINIELMSLIGSVAEKKEIEKVFAQYDVDTIYHAAAYKHVPIIESNPQAGIKNNILGTYYTALAAESSGVERFILISTDKAVRPTNVMGATKRFSEMILQALNNRGSKTIFSMVRFGNVLGSSGSVVPLFKEQISSGGPVTVTHPDIIRYFMTIPEAAELVIQAGSMSRGGDVFVLDMGEPIKIVNLARSMIHLMGMTISSPDNPKGDIEIVFTGLRPGEKLYEELLIGEEAEETNHSMIMREKEALIEWSVVEEAVDRLKDGLAVGSDADLRSELGRVVNDFGCFDKS